jgi:cysteine-rich repeat protein
VGAIWVALGPEQPPPADAIFTGVHTRLLWLGLLSGGCSVDNPWFGLASQGETTMATTDDDSGATTLLPTTDPSATMTANGPGSGSSGVLTATASATGDVSTTMNGAETGLPLPDLGVLCGNNMVEGKEQCDDGNDVPADGCEHNCRPMFEVIEIPGLKNPRDLAVADFNGDGKVDLVVAHQGTMDIDAEYTILINKGGGEFVLEPRDVPLLKNAQRVLVGQLTGDARPDLLLINALGQVQVLENLCDGDLVEFEPQIGFMAPSLVGGRGSKLADLNNDGLDDLLLLTNLGKLYTYVRTGGAFMPPSVYLLDLPEPVAVAAGELILGFAGPHVVVAHAVAGQQLSPLINNGNGSLTKQPLLLSHCESATAAAVAIGDGDQIGSNDLVVACASGRVTLAGADGEGEFFYALEAPVEQFVDAGTLDIYGVDTRSDVYGVSATDSAVVIWVQTGKDFLPAHQEVLSSKPTTAVVVDIDADGASDLAVLLPEAFKVGLLLNQTQKN